MLILPVMLERPINKFVARLALPVEEHHFIQEPTAANDRLVNVCGPLGRWCIAQVSMEGRRGLLAGRPLSHPWGCTGDRTG